MAQAIVRVGAAGPEGPISRQGRAAATVFLLLASLLLCGTRGCDGRLLPRAGSTPVRETALVAIPNGWVDVAGGNLLLRRVDLSIDTRLGTWEIASVWNGAEAAWRFSFDLRYDGTTLVDALGTTHDLGGLANGAPVPGTFWERVNASSVRTRGGLLHRFGPGGRLAEVRYANRAFPTLRYLGAVVAGEMRTVAVLQCTSAQSCEPVYQIERDGLGRVIVISDRVAREARFTWSPAGDLVAARDALDVARGWPGTVYEYDGGGRLLAVESVEGERVEILYGGSSRVALVRVRGDASAPDAIHRFDYTVRGADGFYETLYTDPSGEAHLYGYTGEGFVRFVEVVSLAERSELLLDPNGRVVVALDPAGIATQHEWLEDELAWTILPSGNVVTFSYTFVDGAVDRSNPLARPRGLTRDSYGPLETRFYDGQGDLAAITDAQGDTVLFSWGSLGELTSIVGENGDVSTFSAHGADGHPRVVEEGGRVHSLEYDLVGNLVVDPRPRPGVGGLVSSYYDEDRNLVELQLAAELPGGMAQPADESIRVERRSDGLPIRVTRPWGGDSELDYDARGRLVRRRDRVSPGTSPEEVWHETHFEWDARDRPASVSLPNGMRRDIEWDPSGRPAHLETSRDGVLDSGFEAHYADGRLASVADSASGFLEAYEYDAAGRLARVTHPGGERRELEYDGRNRPTLTRLVESDGTTLASLRLDYADGLLLELVTETVLPLLHAHFAGGEVASVVYGNGLRRTLDYDPETGRLVSAETTTPSLAVLESTLLEDPSGLGFEWLASTVSSETGGGGSVSTVEHYVLGGLGTARVASWSPGGSTLRVHHYDHLSNLAAVSDESGAPLLDATYNAERNRLLSIDSGGQTLAYTWDEAGYATARAGVPITWTGLGLLSGLGDASFTWDSLGRRVAREAGGVTRHWRFGGFVEADAFGSPIAIDLGDVRVDLVAGDHLYRHPDFRGNVKLTTSQAGEVVAHYHYSPYALEAVHGSDTDPDHRFAAGLDMGGVMLVGIRPYDPLAARFLAPDPIRQLIGQHTYTFGNPVQFWDPGGLESYAAQGGRVGRPVGARVGQVVGAAVGAVAGAAAGAALGGPEGAVAGAAAGAVVGAELGHAAGGAAGDAMGTAVGTALDDAAAGMAKRARQEPARIPDAFPGEQPGCNGAAVLAVPAGGRALKLGLVLQSISGSLLLAARRRRLGR